MLTMIRDRNDDVTGAPAARRSSAPAKRHPRRTWATTAAAASVALAALVSIAPVTAHAQAAGAGSAAGSPAASPTGLWKSIDDETKQPKALIRIERRGDAYTGRIEKLLNPSEPDPKCTKCTDERKDQPIQGMTILTGLKASGDDPGEWGDGHILDPNNGKVYRAKMKLAEGGRKLEVRGFVGVSLFGRTQTWLREE